MFTFLFSSAVKNMIRLFIYFKSFYFHHQVFYELIMACFPVGLINSMDRALRLPWQSQMSGFDCRSSLKILGFFLYRLGFHSTAMIMFTFMIFNYFDNFVFSCSRKEKCLFFGISLPWSTNRPLPSSKTLTLGRPSAEPFLWIENDFYLYENEKIISISKAEHLTSFWYRGPMELGYILPIADEIFLF